MIKYEANINTKAGLNARAAATLVQNTNKFISAIFMHKGDMTIDAKSIMGILALGIYDSTSVTFTIDGVDEQQAKAQIVKVVEEIIPNL